MVYRCPVCGSEVMVAGLRMGDFTPRCCGRLMIPLMQRAVVYRCPVCGAEVAVVRKGRGVFSPHCCNRDMERLVA
jgi:desulfoferrodoxin-like iron-binding protein